MANDYVIWLQEMNNSDVQQVGGKNASLGEMIQALHDSGIKVPLGFATTAHAYRAYIEENGLKPGIEEQLEKLKTGKLELAKAGRAIREMFVAGKWPKEVAEAIRQAYRELSREDGADRVDVAVRSSATAEDLPEASFAGQQETFLNVEGEDELLEACRRCYASLYTDRAIAYRQEKGFSELEVALSVGVQKMVRSDKAGSGVMFTLDTETGFDQVVVINAAWGLGENVVQGTVNPDEYIVFKPMLEKRDLVPILGKELGEKETMMVYAKGGNNTTKNKTTPKEIRKRFVLQDDEILSLARWAKVIEDHYERPMDIEWAKDGESNELLIVQARPETVQSQKSAASLMNYKLKESGKRLVSGLSIGSAIAAGEVRRILSPDQERDFPDGAILVTESTDPDWVPIMKKAAGIVTDHGGRTAHAAIVSRELGIPAVVGTGDATEVMDNQDKVTISCAEGDVGYVYDGILDYEREEVSLDDAPETHTEILMNIASPAAAFRWWNLPVKGIGLARMEFIINNIIKVHPMALVKYHELEDDDTKQRIAELTEGYEDKTEYFVERLARGVARIAASRYPAPVILRMSDFKTNEYAELLGGGHFEEPEHNPMLGFRGASRYYSERYRQGFALECQAVKRARERIGLDNLIIMIPFCRTPEEADKVFKELSANGLDRGKDGLKVYVMIEIPSNVILAEEFASRFDGFSIGSNDLTQLVLGVDRDSAELSGLFDERHRAVRRFIAELIMRSHEHGAKVGLCGQAPSDHPDFARFLVEAGIDSISVNPDSVIKVLKEVSRTESNEHNGGS